MSNESRREQFQQRTFTERLLGKLHIDIPLLICLILLSLLSFVVLYSAGSQEMALIYRQAARIGLAFGLMSLLAHVNPYQLKRYSAPLFVVGILMLIAVLVMGHIGKGAQRWLDLGILRFQPAEMIKISTPMMLSWYLSDYALPIKPQQLLVSGILILIPTLLIAKQPDLGTAILVASAGAAVLFFAGLSWRLIVAILAGLAGLAPIVWHYFLHDYQRARIITLLDPEADPLGKGYHIIQSKIAIGSGGVYGKGWLGSKQSELEFLPESSTDFIFAVFAEEFGLFGCVGLLVLYLLVIARCMYIASQAQDTFSRLLAGSLAFTFFVYVFVNIGMVIGILPVVGVPLPLISYGGTSVVTLLSGFGILMSIHTHKKLIPY